MGSTPRRALIFIGPQGCGKATQSEILQEKQGYIHLDTGAYLRSFAKKEGSDPLLIHVRETISQGLLLEDEVVCDVFERALKEKVHGEDRITLDGIPRTVSQAALILNILRREGYEHVEVVNLEVPREESIARLKKRAVIEKRPDDADEEKIFRRLAIYENETKPVLSYLKSQGITVHTIDGLGSTTEIAERIKKALSE